MTLDVQHVYDFDRLGEKEIVALFGEPSRAARK
jgi:hypothetical protein